MPNYTAKTQDKTTQYGWKNHEDDPMEQMRRSLLAKEDQIQLHPLLGQQIHGAPRPRCGRAAEPAAPRAQFQQISGPSMSASHLPVGFLDEISG